MQSPRISFFYVIIVLFCWLSFEHVNAQCINVSGPGTPNPVTGEYGINCNGAPVSITANSPIVSSSAIIWTSGDTGGTVNFTPDCSNLGPQSYTPCLPSGTVIPNQTFSFPSKSVSISPGQTDQTAFTVSGLCYVPGQSYSGDIGISLSGSGDVSLSVQLPDGSNVGPLTFPISIINSISPVPISLLGLNTDPNGEWIINLKNESGSTIGFNLAPTTITLDGTTTTAVFCADPVVLNVFGACPTFIDAGADNNDVCSGEPFTLGANLNPAAAPNVNYTWTGNGITNPSETNPQITLTNFTCNPIIENYSVSITCSNDGSTVVNNYNFSITVYPDIDPGAILVDNTTFSQDPNCSIEVIAPCPNFTVNGIPAMLTQNYTAGDNGLLGNFVVSSGGPCEEILSPTVNCLGTCVRPDITLTPTLCNGNDQFLITANVTNMGDATSFDLIASDGSSQNITGTGTFNFGFFDTSDYINFKVVDGINPSCNFNLGSYTQNCIACPSIFSVNAIAPNLCYGQAITLTAVQDLGVEDVDFTVQWFKNGVAIPGASTAIFNHLLEVADRCQPETQIFTAELTCLNGGNIGAVTSMDTNPTNVYPRPELGVDFIIDNCNVQPIDNCGNLVIDIMGATNPSAWSNPNTTNTRQVVSYSVSFSGAPSGVCVDSGSFTARCATCTEDPGDGGSTATEVCWGDSFEINNPGVLVTSPGYEVAYVVTNQHPSRYPSYNDLLNASITGVQGPYPAPGNFSETFVNDGSTFNPPSAACGDTYYFTPLLSFSTDGVNGGYTESGEFTADQAISLFPDPAPGIGGGTISIPNLAYCPGLTTYDVSLCVYDESFDVQEPLAESILFGLIDGLPGGIFSSFPNIDDVHDSDICIAGSEPLCLDYEPFCYYQYGWPSNPSEEVFNLVMINLLTFGGEITLSYDLEVNMVNGNQSFPASCPNCELIGDPIVVKLLPSNTIPSIPAIAPICSGESLNLTILNPQPIQNTRGLHTWYEGNPNSGGIAITDPFNYTPSYIGTQQVCVEYTYCEDGGCSRVRCTNLEVRARPTLNQPSFTPNCLGEAIDLTLSESSITTASGTFDWYLGDSQTNGAILGDPTSIIPIGSEQYCAVFTDAVTGCESQICSQANLVIPPLLIDPMFAVCPGDILDLISMEPLVTTTLGTFVWFDGDPLSTGLMLTPDTNGEINIMPSIADVYYVQYTDGTNGCTSTKSISFTYSPAASCSCPALPGTTTLAQTTVCENGNTPAVSIPSDASFLGAIDMRYIYAVTDPTVNDSIIGITENGSFDFWGIPVGDQLCYTGIIYDQAELDNILTTALSDPTFGPLLGALGIGINSTISELYGILKENEASLAPLGLVISDIPDLLNFFEVSLPGLLGVPAPCIRASATSDCVTVVGSCTVTLRVKAFLEGAFDLGSGEMHTILKDEGLIPLDQPYNRAPWNYTGGEFFTSVSAIPAGMVDWVLVEIRDGADPSIILDVEAGVLLEDGLVVDTDGGNLQFSNIAANTSYYLSIRHRNHLDIRSQFLLTIPNFTPYNFSDNTRVFSPPGISQVVNYGGTYCMRAGDISGDGNILVDDFNLYYGESSGINEYLDSDCNLNRVVTVGDFNLMVPNTGIMGASDMQLP